MRLRPHHLLCIQSYTGKGYDAEFIENMNQIVKRLQGQEPVPVEIILSEDDLCAHCPNMIEGGACKDSEKVLHYDKKTAEHFNIEEKIYIYQNIIPEIRKKLSMELLEDICIDCEWFSLCKTRTGMN